MYKVVGYDSFSHEGFDIGKFRDLQKAKDAADRVAKGKQMTLAYVYDNAGRRVYTVGSY